MPPLPFLAVAFCAGIMLAGRIGHCFWPAYASAWLACAALAAIRRGQACAVVSCVLAFFCGAAAMCGAGRLPADHVSGYLRGGQAPLCVIKGIVSDEPQRDSGVLFFHFQTEELETGSVNRSCSGEVAAAARITQDVRYGQEVLVRGQLRKPAGLRRFDQRPPPVLRITGPADIIILPRWRGSRCKDLALRMKRCVERLICRYTSAVPGAVIEAMLIGERRGLPRSILDAMMKSGTIHVLVVSGFNVGLVAGVIMLVLKIVRLGRRLKFVLVMPAIGLYCLATGASPPVVRATIMAAVMMTAYLFRRQADIAGALSCAACGILIYSPGQLFDISFQLSFASVIAIVWLYPALRRRLDAFIPKPAPVRWCADSLLVSFSAWLGTCGFIACYFKFFSPVTVLANLVIVPLATLITLCGISRVAAGSVCPVLAPFISRTCEALVVLLVGCNAFFLSLPGAYFRFGNTLP